MLNFAATKVNIEDRELLKNEGIFKSNFGKRFADIGYISEKLQKLLFVMVLPNSLVSKSDKNKKAFTLQ